MSRRRALPKLSRQELDAIIQAAVASALAAVRPKKKKKSKPRRLPQPLTEQESEALFKQAQAALDAARTPGKKLAAHRDLVMTSTGCMAGLRVAELCSLRLEHLDQDGAMIRVALGKGSKDRDVPIHVRLLPLLKAWIGPRLAGYVFPGPGGRRLSERTFRRRLDVLAKAAGITKRVYPHLLRHTFATNYLDANRDNLRQLQELLGHASIATTQIYTRVRPERLREGIDRLGGANHDGQGPAASR